MRARSVPSFTRTRSVLLFALTGLLVAIAMATSPRPLPGQPPAEQVLAGQPPSAPLEQPAPIPSEHGAVPTSAPAPTTQLNQAEKSPCPDDMQYVDTTFCTDIERECIDVEQERRNHLSICHAFARHARCRSTPRHISFCIDRYEYPNRLGAHPEWMVDWFQAQATCEARGKRLCWASEWTAACEGPEHTPFPYGWERDHDKCNMDNFYIEPRKPGPKAQFFFYSKTQDVALPELVRLDQSVPSGSMETCKSGFGVYDMTGNLDEWVVSDEAPREKSRWAGLKGGAWGHVRNQCRPMTYSHEPEFAYYFVGFRCCSDVPGAPIWVPSPHALPAPQVEPHDFAPFGISEAPLSADFAAPGPSKGKVSGMRKRD